MDSLTAWRARVSAARPGRVPPRRQAGPAAVRPRPLPSVSEHFGGVEPRSHPTAPDHRRLRRPVRRPVRHSPPGHSLLRRDGKQGAPPQGLSSGSEPRSPRRRFHGSESRSEPPAFHPVGVGRQALPLPDQSLHPGNLLRLGLRGSGCTQSIPASFAMYESFE